MENPLKNDRAVLFVIFASSLASLSYEIALIRIFSITLSYHFAFMVISIALMGIGASGTLLSIFPGLKNRDFIPRYSLLLAAAIPLSYLLANAVPFDPAKLSWDRSQLLLIIVYYLILSIPFLCFGLVVSTAFSTISSRTGAVYAADLLGAGTGSLLMIVLLYASGPDTIVFFVALLIATALVLHGGGRMRILSGMLIIVSAAVLLVRPAFIEPAISQYKPLELALKFPGAEHLATYHSPYAQADAFRSPAVRFAPGLSLSYLEPLPEQTGIAIDGSELHAVTDEKDGGSLDFMNYLPSSLVYRVFPKEDALVLDPKGGLETLVAKHQGAGTVFAVESNPLVQKVAQEISGDMTDADRVRYRSGLGRTWLDASGKKFDIIDMALMGSLPSASFGFAEDYRYTVEAFRTYLGHLKPDGVLSVNLYLLPPARAELRIIATIFEAAAGLGITDSATRLAAIRSWDTLTVLYKKSPLSDYEILHLQALCRDMRFDMVYYPGISREESNVFIKTPGHEYFDAVQQLVNENTRGRFLSEYLFDIRPASDDRPFFHYTLKFENIGILYLLMREKWQYYIEQGYLLPLLLMQVLIVGAVLILLPLFSLRKAGPAPLSALTYFAVIGLGYLFIEVSFIQKMILALEHPSFAAGAVIASILIGSGLGSAVSQRVPALRSPFMLLAVSAAAVAYVFALPPLVPVIGHLSLALKIPLVFLLLLPAGFVMGIPLPFGISLLSGRYPHLIPWAWAVNGCFSVLSPILAIMIALSTGFTVVILFGAGLYFAGFFLIRQVSEAVHGS
jgi:hypothetical protein